MRLSFHTIWLVIALLFNGASVMAMEILGTRMLSPYFGTTLYVWTALLVATMSALALGYFLGGRLADWKQDWRIFYGLFFLSGLLTLTTVVDAYPTFSFASSLGLKWGPLAAALILFFPALMIYGMVSPYAVKMRSKSLERVGRKVGNVYAISTIGSIMGALIVVYVLIPSFELTNMFIIRGAILLVIGAVWFVVHRTKLIMVAITILLAVLIILLRQAPPADADVLDHRHSFYGDLYVEQLSDELTCLSTNNIPFSCYNAVLDGSAYPYVNVMARGLEQVSNPQRALVIGDGSGLITRALLRDDPDLQVDVVDIDPAAFELAAQYLHFADQDQVSKIVADGRQFVRDTTTQYDLIMIDVYDGASPILHLYTADMFQLARSKLTDQGVLVVNAFGFTAGNGSEGVKSLFLTMEHVFGDVYMATTGAADPTIKEYTNFILFGSDHELQRLGSAFEFRNLDGGRMVTDEFNPLETMYIPASQELINWYVFGKT